MNGVRPGRKRSIGPTAKIDPYTRIDEHAGHDLCALSSFAKVNIQRQFATKRQERFYLLATDGLFQASNDRFRFGLRSQRLAGTF
jgi:hypothetical protein